MDIRVVCICKYCSRSFKIMPAELRKGRGKYCSRWCSSRSQDKRVRIKCCFCGFSFLRKLSGISGRSYCSRLCVNRGSRGTVPWNKGKIQSQSLGEKNHAWKGDSVGYGGLHMWVRKHLGTPSLCEHCHKTEGRFEWANISREYKRELSDWRRLCTRCHRIYDFEWRKQNNL